MNGIISITVFVALFYFAAPLAIIALGLAFLALPFFFVGYLFYRFVLPKLKKKLYLWQQRRAMRKRIRAMLRKNLRYLRFI